MFLPAPFGLLFLDIEDERSLNGRWHAGPIGRNSDGIFFSLRRIFS